MDKWNALHAYRANTPVSESYNPLKCDSGVEIGTVKMVLEIRFNL